MKTYIVIYNQNSRGKKYKKEELEKKFIEHDLEAKIFVTKQINEVDLVIKEFTDSNKYVYIGIGGDGTLNSLINSLLNNKINLPEVACISSGSGSDFLRTFAMPNNIDEAILRIKNDENYLIDTALIKSSNKSKYFINVLNYGFLAETVNLSEKLPIIFKRFRYPLSFWLKLVTGKQSHFELDTNKYKFDSNAFNISICNGQFFGGGWNISPKSSLQDGLLNVQIFKVTKVKAMKLFFLAKKGLHLTDPDVILKKSDKITLKSNQPIEIDGDFFDYGPAEIYVKKHSIQLKI
jgi:YegS/Rv2252/BmrU family lipid kinase